MKILILTHSYPSALRPTQAVFIQQEVSHLRDRAEVAVLITRPYGRGRCMERDSGQGSLYHTRYLSVPRRYGFSVTRASLWHSVKKLIRQIRPEVVHAHYLFPCGSILPLVKAELGLPTVLTIHGSDWYIPHTQKRIKTFIPGILTATNRILTVGSGLQKDITAEFPGLASKIFVKSNGVDLSQFTLQNKAACRRKLHLDLQSRHLLVVANISPVKGLDILIEAVARFSPHYPGTEVHIIGNTLDRRYADSLFKSLRRHNLDNVHVYPQVEQQVLNLWYGAADMLILPSRTEGFGIVILEALACGRPVVVTRAGGPQDIFTPAMGIMVDPGDAEQLARAVGDLLDTLDEYAPGLLRELVLPKYRWSSVAESLLAHYRSVIEVS